MININKNKIYINAPIQTEYKSISNISYVSELAKDLNFSILKNLGINPEEITDQSKIRKSNISWKYENNHFHHFDFHFFEKPEATKLTLLSQFLNKLEEGCTYAVTPVIVSLPNANLGSSILSLSNQILITKELEVEKLEAWLLGVIETNKYLYNVDDLLNGIFVLKYRVISINKDVYIKVNNKNMSQLSSVNKYLYLRTNKNNIISLNKINNNLFPNTDDLSKYGVLLSNHFEYHGNTGQFYQYKIGIRILVENKYEDNMIIRKCSVFKNDRFILSYIDSIESNKDYFIRNINNKYTLYINKNNNDNNSIINCESTIKCNEMKKGKRELIIDDKILTFDIESFLDETNSFEPYACGFFEGKKSFIFYLTDYKNKDEMLYECIKNIMINYNHHTIYVHNLSGFDAIFIIHSLIKFHNMKVEPFYKANKLYSLSLTYQDKENKNKKIYKIVFKDSYLLLGSSLRKLGKDFNVETQKGFFPYSFVSRNKLNYIGKIPDYKYFTNDLNFNDYLKMCNNNSFWSLKKETINYLKSDLISLYQIIIKFRNEIYYSESINLTSVSSLSSLTSKIFKTNYYNPSLNSICIIKGKTHLDLRDGYYGGRVDVFNSIGENIYIYDVNSLYPHVMVKNEFPIGQPLLSYDTNLDNYFGFVFCHIETPEYLDKPVLPYRGKDGRLYNPIGNWDGMYFSEELKKAVKEYNYKVKVIYGYKFKKSNDLFNDFIIKYYNLRNEAKEKGFFSKAFTAKLIMNTLYGRLGMKESKDIIKYVSKSESDLIHLYHNVSDNFTLNEDLEYIKYSKKVNGLLYEIKGLEGYLDYIHQLDGKSNDFESSLPLAMAITAYARMFMLDYINNENYTIFSTDTDSIAINKPLPDHLVGNKLGQFKLEYIAKKAIFLSPKLYILELLNGEQVIKARSLGDENLTMNDFIQMSYGLKLNKTKTKFITDMKNGGSVKKLNFSLELSPLNLKRQPHYSNDGRISHTTPLKVQNGEIENVNINILTSIVPVHTHKK